MDIKKNIFQRAFDVVTGAEKKEAMLQMTNEINHLRAEVKAEHEASGVYSNVFAISFNGEKNLGEVGNIVRYNIDYNRLRLRSWQSLIESEVTQAIIYKLTKWVIGSGLKLASEPANYVLESEKITLDKIVYSKQVEQLFDLFASSKMSDYAGMESLNKKAYTAYLNSKVGGDVLVILRYNGSNVTIQLIDGEHIQSPTYGTELYPTNLPNGHVIIDGIEYDQQKKHVKYYIKNKNFTYDIIDAVGESSGLTQAYLVKGLGYRLDNQRGLPLFSAVLEKLKKMERYESATLGSAEERQKIAYQIVHSKNSTGESPLTKGLANAMNYNPDNADLPKDAYGKELANTVAVSTNKQTFNMGLDSELKILESKNELYFKDYYTVNIGAVCAAIGAPQQVIMSAYEGNYSASRMAVKDWEHTLEFERDVFSEQFYQPIFIFWLHINILENKINAPGYLQAFLKGNNVVLESYRKCRFVGASVPHIDPLKEVKAIRESLGALGENMPLITLEQATERFNGSESHSNLIQFSKELADSKTLKLVAEPVVVKDKKKKSNSDVVTE